VTWFLFAIAAAVIVVAGEQLARYGDVIGEKSGLGRRH
jgi:cation:H+ antiporter